MILTRKMKIKQKICVIEHFKIKLLIISFVILIATIIAILGYSGYKSNQYAIEVSTINTKYIEQNKNEQIDIIGEEEIEYLRETINLKEFYPEIYTANTFCEIPEEVLEELLSFRRKRRVTWRAQGSEWLRKLSFS